MKRIDTKKDSIRLMIYIEKYYPLFSGYVYHLLVLLPLLKELGVEPWILTVKNEGLKSEEILDGILIRRKKIPKIFKYKHSFKELALLPTFYRFRKEFDLALTITDGPACPIIKLICGKPLIRQMIITENLRKKFRGIIGFIKSINFRFADSIITISPATKNAYLKVNWSANKISMIPHGVDTNIFRPAISLDEVSRLRSELGLPPLPNLLFLTVGAIQERKGTDNLVEVWHNIIKENPNVYLVVIGPVNEESYYRNILDKIEHYNLAKNLIFVGRSNRVMEYMRCVDGFVFASKNEGFGIVLIEAMASGLPVVVFSIKDILPFIINDDSKGILVEPGDVRQLAEEIIKLVENPELRIKIGNAAREEVINRFSLQQEAAAHAELYWKTVGKSI